MDKGRRTSAERRAAKAAATASPRTANYDAVVRAFEDLNDRQRRGVALWKRLQSQNGTRIALADNTALWFSQSNDQTVYRVERAVRDRRGKVELEYRCQCGDFEKEGRFDCKHIFAERLHRGEVIIEDAPSAKHVSVKATRQPARKRLAYDGRTVRSAQRSARRKMPARIPELISSPKRAFDTHAKGVIIPLLPQKYRGGRPPAPAATRAAALVMKVACGLSASEMIPYYERVIEDGLLRLRRAPNEDTLSDWMNDERLTPVLREFLRITSLPYREREIGAIIDSSKVSQLMTAHYKEVEYNNHDERPNADWMKAHALVGVETLVVMGVEFSGVFGKGTHDNNFLLPLVDGAVQTFPLEFLLGDKAYLSEAGVDELAKRGIKAVIPVKKRWFRDEKRLYSEALTHLVEWHDRNENRDFHALYRFRSKVECLFSVLKRVADGYCWSRGRKREVRNANEPCVAWMNELLCKFIYVNLRATVLLEEETGVKIDYLVRSRRFPAPDEPLLKTNVA